MAVVILSSSNSRIIPAAIAAPMQPTRPAIESPIADSAGGVTRMAPTRHWISLARATARTNSLPLTGWRSANASNAAPTGLVGCATVTKCVSLYTSAAELIELTNAAFSASSFSRRPTTVLDAAPLNSFSTSSERSIASSCEPPAAQPTQLTNARTPSWRMFAGSASYCVATAKRASARVTAGMVKVL